MNHKPTSEVSTPIRTYSNGTKPIMEKKIPALQEDAIMKVRNTRLVIKERWSCARLPNRIWEIGRRLVSGKKMKFNASGIKPAKKIPNMIPFQPIRSLIRPPKAKLKIGTITMIPLIVAKAPAASNRPYESLMIARIIEAIEAAPRPCSTRASTSTSKDSAEAASSPPRANPTRPTSSGRRRPYLSDRGP